MKTWLWAGLMAAVVAVSFAPDASEAKRLGGGKSLGMQRAAPPPSAAPNAVPAKPAAAPTNAAAPAAAAAPAPKRSWMGPLAGLAAGLGIAALMSHLGMGEAMGNFLMLALLAVVAVVAIRFLMNRFGRGNAAPGGMAMAGAGAGSNNLAGNTGWQPNAAPPLQRVAEPAFSPTMASPALASSAATPALAAAPAGFDTEGFERIAKMIFIRLQAANDKSDLNDLRTFTTPEMFAAIRLDLQDRGPTQQQTDVVKVDAQVIEVTEEADRQLVSVRFHGLIREDLNGTANDFDEVWHLVKPNGSGDAGWAIAGIQQRQLVQ